jgi:hypothetical protein
MMRDERGGIITGWIFRLLIAFAIGGLALFETGAVIVNLVSTDSLASKVADAAAESYARDGSTTKARQACERRAEEAGAECIDVTVRRSTLSARVRKTASTLVVDKIGPLEKYATAEAEASTEIP